MAKEKIENASGSDVTVDQVNEKTSEVKSEEVEVTSKEDNKTESYFKQIGMKYGRKSLDQHEARPFIVDSNGLVTIAMFDQITFKFKLLSGEGITEINKLISDITNDIKKIIKLYKLGDTTIEDLNVPHDLCLESNYRFLRVTLPYVTKSEQIHTAIYEVLKNRSIEGVIEFRKMSDDILKLYINDKSKESSNTVFAKGFAALGYTDYNRDEPGEPYITGASFIESNIGFEYKDICKMNTGALVLNKVNLYNNPEVKNDYKPYTINYRRRASLIVYEIDDVNKSGEYVLNRYIVRAGISKNKYEKEGKFSFNYSGYIFDYKKERIAVKEMNEIFKGENNEFILSKLIGAPEESIKISRFVNDINFINKNIFDNVDIAEEDEESTDAE